MCFRERGNLRQHRHCFLGKFAHRRLAREHDAIGAVKNCVGDISCLGPRRQTARHHRFEHLRRSNNRLSRKIRFCDELLLHVGDLLNRHFHPEIAARDHDAVGRRENFVEVSEGVGSLDLCNNERLSAHSCRSRTHSLDVRGAFDERLAHGVHTMFERELKTGAVVFGKRADAQINAGKV